MNGFDFIKVDQRYKALINIKLHPHGYVAIQ